MTNRTTRRLDKAAGSLMALALVAVSPGLAGYEALAQVVVAVPVASPGEDTQERGPSRPTFNALRLSLGSGGITPCALNRIFTGTSIGCEGAVGVPAHRTVNLAASVGGAPTVDGQAAPGPQPSPLEALELALQDPVTAECARRVVDRKPWYEMPYYLALLNVSALRGDLRRCNLHGTGHLDAEYRTTPPGIPERWLAARSPDGRFNDPDNPDMGKAGAPFGRMQPLDRVQCKVNLPGDAEPREISLRLMTRKEFKPATIVNNLAMIWIQFQVNDWVRRGRDAKRPINIPLKPGDPWPQREMWIESTERTRPPQGVQGPPAYPNKGTHWWDGSQIYGSSAERLSSLRSGTGGKMRVNGRLLPLDANEGYTQGKAGIDLTGANENYWVGLSMLHTLFVLEHNAIAERLAQAYPDKAGDDEWLFDKARLVNSALMAKIHTIEWTPAILPNPVTQKGLNANWYGLAGKRIKNSWIGRILPRHELLTGIPGTKPNHFGADYSLTEEFDVAYRQLHPMVPDEFRMYSARDGRFLGTMAFNDLQGLKTRDAVNQVGMANLFYSLGLSHPGAVRLQNYPKSLQNFQHFSGRTGDLAAADIVRGRERCVPRYNDFRQMLRLPRFKTFLELTGGDEALARDIEEVYHGDIDRVDTVVGMQAEPLPPGFGFGDTAFRIFIVMASRRLNSDRFYNKDYRPEIYTPAGMQWVEDNGMKDVLLRHYPELKAALEGKDNVFVGLWNKVGK